MTTFVLVPGMWLGAWAWRVVTARLRAGTAPGVGRPRPADARRTDPGAAGRAAPARHAAPVRLAAPAADRDRGVGEGAAHAGRVDVPGRRGTGDDRAGGSVLRASRRRGTRRGTDRALADAQRTRRARRRPRRPPRPPLVRRSWTCVGDKSRVAPRVGHHKSKIGEGSAAGPGRAGRVRGGLSGRARPRRRWRRPPAAGRRSSPSRWRPPRTVAVAGPAVPAWSPAG